MARSTRWPGRLSRKLAKETVEGVALINALRVEPELGARARRPASDDRAPHRNRLALSGRKIYSTGAPILKWYRSRPEPTRRRPASVCFWFRRGCRERGS